MTEINFYVSKEQGLEHRISIAYRLIQRAIQRDLKIHIHTDSEMTSTKIDDYLWNKDVTSFIPHSIVNTESTEPIPNKASADLKDITKPKQINISHDFEPLTECDYLINLSNQRPVFFSRFLKVAEILDNNEEIITAGRKRYSFYRDRGYTLGYHQL
ncbi:MAG: DNA polymerase III subunit chi [Cocleimonas sp.]